MEQRKTIFDYIGQVFTIFGVTILLINLFCVMFGENARQYSTMFALGDAGITVSTMLQFLMVSILITVLRYIFFTDGVIKRLSLAARTGGMFIAVFLTIISCTLLFDWFPIDMWQAWVGFFVSFGICGITSTLITLVKERMENRRLEQALLRAQNEDCD